MARLRAPGGCPWDREQTFDTIKPYLLEETYEVMDAIDARDWRELAERAGRLLLQAVFFSQMAAEAESVPHRRRARRHQREAGPPASARLRRARPRTPATTSASIWSEIKAEETQGEGRDAQSLLLDGVPRALAGAGGGAADHVARRSAPDSTGRMPSRSWKSCDEELAEFDAARRNASPTSSKTRLGDLLFVLVNLARFVKVDPEQALRKTNAKFRRRFGHVEQKLARAGQAARPIRISRRWRRCGRRPSGADMIEIRALTTHAEFEQAVRTAEGRSGDSPTSNCCRCGCSWSRPRSAGRSFGAFDGEPDGRLSASRFPACKPAAKAICTATCWACCPSIAIAASAAC